MNVISLTKELVISVFIIRPPERFRNPHDRGGRMY